MSVKSAAREVAKAVYCKYYHDKVCCITLEGMFLKIQQEYEKMKVGKQRLSQGREGAKEVAYLKNRLRRRTRYSLSFWTLKRRGTWRR